MCLLFSFIEGQGQGQEDSAIRVVAQEQLLLEFQALARTAFTATRSAQSLDHEITQHDSNREPIFKEYDRALTLIDKALSSQGQVQGAAADLSFQLRTTRKLILERVSDLQHQTQTTNGGSGGPLEEPRSPNMPPSYGDVMAMSISSTSTSTSTSTGYGPLAAALDEIMQDDTQGTARPLLPLNARELYSIPGEVQIYFISSQDNVSAPSYPSWLRLVQLETPTQPSLAPVQVVAAAVPAFLQVGDWTYPLIPHHSPLFRSTEGIYIFPDLSTTSNQIPQGRILTHFLPYFSCKSNS